MTPEAESQGLPQGFNDELIASPEEIVVRPRPQSEAFPIADRIAAERQAYDERHSVAALRDRRAGGDAEARFAPAEPETPGEEPLVEPDPVDEETRKAWDGEYTAAGLKELLDENEIRYDPKWTKPKLIALAAANFELNAGDKTVEDGAELPPVVDGGTATFGGAGAAG
jgi:hypothetical protein